MNTVFADYNKIRWKYSDIQLCHTLAERWWPRTNTFHLPFGELTITIEDVCYILGLPVGGEPITPPENIDMRTLVQQSLGKVPKEKNLAKNLCSYSWLVRNFKQLPEDTTDGVVVRIFLTLFNIIVHINYNDTKIHFL